MNERMIKFIKKNLLQFFFFFNEKFFQNDHSKKKKFNATKIEKHKQNVTFVFASFFFRLFKNN